MDEIKDITISQSPKLNVSGGKGFMPLGELMLLEENITKGIKLPPIEPPKSPNHGDNSGGNNKLPELKSSEVNEILSAPPGWLISWGSTLLFSVLLLLIAVSWWVKYPDLVTGNMKIVAENLPKSVIAKVEGKLMKLFVKDNYSIYKGDKIAFIEAIGNHNEVLALASFTDSLVKLTLDSNFIKLYSAQIPSYFQLGELQKSFQSFQETFVKVKSFVGKGTYLQKRNMLHQDLKTMVGLKENLNNQINSAKEDYDLTEDDFNRQKGLLKDKVISKNDYNALLAKLLSKKQGFEQLKSGIKNQEISQNLKRQEILELDKNILEQKNNLIQSLYSLKSEIDAWKQNYICYAPITGKISFIQSIQENQLIKMGQELVYILPNGEGFHGEMNIGQYNFGKVKIGQEVIVKLKSYPFEEYGTVKGKISNISGMVKDSAYFLKVNFPNGLYTSSKKSIPFRHGTEASGEIITEEKRLIERFLKEFMRIFER